MTEQVARGLTPPVKILVLGATGAGKTGALASLVHAGYRIRMLDADAGSGLLRTLIGDTQRDALSVITLTEKLTPCDGHLFALNPTEWMRCTNALTKWIDDEGRDLGSVSTWDSNDVLVIDTLRTLARCAYAFARKQSNRERALESGMLWRADMGGAQSLILGLIDFLHSKHVKCNVVVNAHVRYSKPDGSSPTDIELEQATREKRVIRMPGYPEVIGAKAGPIVPIYFNDMVLIRRGSSGDAVIHTGACDDVDCKTSAPGRVKRTYPQRTGLAELFNDLTQIQSQTQGEHNSGTTGTAQPTTQSTTTK